MIRKSINSFEEDMQYLINRFEVSLIIIFGGYRKCENHDVNKDIDILVVSDCFKHILAFKRSKIVKNCFLNIHIDPICLTQSEYILAKKKASPFFSNIIMTGKVIYDKFDPTSTTKHSHQDSQNHIRQLGKGKINIT